MLIGVYYFFGSNGLLLLGGCLYLYLTRERKRERQDFCHTDSGLRGQATAGCARLRVRREESPVFIGRHAG